MSKKIRESFSSYSSSLSLQHIEENQENDQNKKCYVEFVWQFTILSMYFYTAKSNITPECYINKSNNDSKLNTHE